MFVEVIDALNRAEVDYVIVGGVATVLHGFPRTTADIDLVISFEPPNAERALETVKSLGYAPAVPVDPAGLADESTRDGWYRSKGMLALSFRNPSRPLVEVDIFVRHPLPFAELKRDSLEVRSQGPTVRICSLDHLIRMKTGTGRSRDEEDVRRLSAIQARIERDGREN